MSQHPSVTVIVGAAVAQHVGVSQGTVTVFCSIHCACNGQSTIAHCGLIVSVTLGHGMTVVVIVVL